jgi:hypothetical protein
MQVTVALLGLLVLGILHCPYRTIRPSIIRALSVPESRSGYETATRLPRQLPAEHLSCDVPFLHLQGGKGHQPR